MRHDSDKRFEIGLRDVNPAVAIITGGCFVQPHEQRRRRKPIGELTADRRGQIILPFGRYIEQDHRADVHRRGVGFGQDHEMIVGA